MKRNRSWTTAQQAPVAARQASALAPGGSVQIAWITPQLTTRVAKYARHAPTTIVAMTFARSLNIRNGAIAQVHDQRDGQADRQIDHRRERDRFDGLAGLIQRRA